MQAARTLTIVALALSTISSHQRSAAARPGEAFDACGVDNPMVYIRSSLQRVEGGEELTTVLDTLACIAKSKARSNAIGAALVALFHLADDDRQRRKYLLELVDAGDYPSRNAAGYLLIFVADEEVRKELLEQAKARWMESADFSGQTVALVELGDLSFLRWLEEHVLTSELHERIRDQYEVEAAKIRIQHNPEGMLEQIASEKPSFNRRWLVEQALRHGVDRKGLGEALVNFVHGIGEAKPRSSPNRRSSPSTSSGLLDICRESDLLPETELAELDRRTRDVSYDPAGTVWWATLQKTKRRAFYRLDRKNDSSHPKETP
jgi:hypothetical protein